jgi:EAL domain-containing protein (putative c-di-GMP-specific phosphodiesterase class I)
MTENISKQKIFIKRYDIALIILSCLLVAISITLGVFMYRLVIENDISDEIIISVYVILPLIVIITITSSMIIFRRSIYVRRIKFNEDIFSTGHGVFSEKMFVDSIKSRVNRFRHRSVIIAFSIFDLKKIIMNLFGHDMVAKIAGNISGTLIRRYQQNRNIAYGFDYNENFLLFFPFTKDINEVLDELNLLNKEVLETIKNTGINMEVTIYYGVCYNNHPNLSTYEMIRRALISAEFGMQNRSMINIFEEYMVDATQVDLMLSDEISKGLENNEFEMYYQPKYDLKLNRFTGAEALIRWNHPTRGFLYPASFIPFAERSDLITKIDRYVINATCEDIAKWKVEGKRLIPVSVNLSRRSLYASDLLEYINETLKKHKTNPLLLEIELTESIASKDILFVSSLIKKFKAMNIKVSIDDFGTGYSSLSYLKRMPFDVMKIDKLFFDDIEIDKKARDVVKAMIDVAIALDVYVIAEGVQTAKQVSILEAMGCSGIQGYYYSTPLPKDKLQEFLEKKSEGRKKKK